MNTGTLFGIGVGPGDPELITLKAARALAGIRVILAAASPERRLGALESPPASVLRGRGPAPGLPHGPADKAKLEAAWLTTPLMTPRSGAAATPLHDLGDPLTYSTRLSPAYPGQLPHAAASDHPGITSYQAAAARTGASCVEGEEACWSARGLFGRKTGETAQDAVSAVILKAYRNFRRSARPSSGLTWRVVRVGLPPGSRRRRSARPGRGPGRAPLLFLVLMRKKRGPEDETHEPVHPARGLRFTARGSARLWSHRKRVLAATTGAGLLAGLHLGGRTRPSEHCRRTARSVAEAWKTCPGRRILRASAIPHIVPGRSTRACSPRPGLPGRRRSAHGRGRPAWQQRRRGTGGRFPRGLGSGARPGQVVMYLAHGTRATGQRFYDRLSEALARPTGRALGSLSPRCIRTLRDRFWDEGVAKCTCCPSVRAGFHASRDLCGQGPRPWRTV
jgi:precorrin-2/cobalt-factor-2 C20-methyltransferase